MFSTTINVLLAIGLLWVSTARGTESALADQPIATFQRALLDLAFETATAIPIRPHIKDRSKAQAAVVDAGLALHQPRWALAHIPNIENWRRGASYADLALYAARQDTANEAKRYLKLAGQMAQDPQVQDWRRDRIRVKMAQAYLWLGQPHQAEQAGAGAAASEVGRVAHVKAVLSSTNAFSAQLKSLDNLMSQQGYDAVRNALDAYAVLFDRFYDNANRRAQVEVKINAAIVKLPVWFRIHLIMALAKSAWAHADPAKAIELYHRAQRLVETHQWPPRYDLVLKAQLAQLRAQVEGRQQARADLDAALQTYETVREQMFNIDRAGALRPLAEAYHTMGESTTALVVYRRAIEEGVVNPNSRPRAEDLAATCRSMALHGVAPDPALWTRMRQIRTTLGSPW